MKRIIFIIAFISFFIHAAQIPTPEEILSRAVNFYNDAEYSKAFELFQQIPIDNSVNRLTIEIADYYSAECLLALGITEGTISKFEYFLKNHKTSAYRNEVLYKLGVVLFERGNFEKAIERFMTLINDFPESEYKGYAYYWIGESFSSLGRNYEAEEYLLQAFEKNEKDKYADYNLFALAKVYENLEKYEKAAGNYDKILSNYWDSSLTPLAQLRIGICYFHLKDYQKSILELSDPLLLNLQPKEKYQADYLLANSYFKLKEYNEARKLFTEVMNQDFSNENSEQLEYGLGWVSFQLAEYEEGYNIFNKLSLSANDTLAASSLYWSAECKRYLGEVDFAMNIFERYLQKYPRHYLAPTAQYNIGLIYFNKKIFGRAEEYFVSVVQEKDKNINAKAYLLLGEIRLGEKNFDEAKDFYQRAIDLSNRNEDLANRAKFGLGVSLYFLNEYKSSVDVLNEVNARFHTFEKDKMNFYLAEAHFSLGHYDAALRHYLRTGTNDEIISRQVLYGKAYAYYNLKDFTNSAYFFNEYSTKYKNDLNYTDARLRLADSYYGLKDFQRASDIYNLLFNRERKNVNDDNAYYQYGQALFKSGKYTNAIDEFASLQRRFPRSKYSDDSQYIIGWIYFQRNQFQEAIESYNQLLSKYPSSALKPITYYSIGDAYYNLGDYDNAIAYYTKIIDEFSTTQYVYDAINGIQYCYLAQDSPNKAIELIDRFISANPGYAYSDQILYKKGEVWYSLGEYEKAQGGYKEFIRSFPKSTLVSNAYYWIGKCEQMLGKNESALSNFEYVYKNHLSSEYGVSAVLEIGKIFNERNNFEDEISLYENVIKSLPGSPRLPELIYNKGIALVQNKNFQDAYKTFNEVTQYYAESVFTERSKIELGKLELQNERYENAEVLFSQAGAGRVDDIGAEAQYYYGLTLMKQKKTYDAITVFVRVKSVFIAFDEWYTNALISLGDCYVELGDKKEAREMYRAVLKRHPNDEYSQIVKEKINRL